MIDASCRRISTSNSFNLILLVLLCAALYWPGLVSIPPIDRDEARFAQATKQMVESDDLLHIRFLDEPRHKKPPGIYWMQYVSVKASAWVSGGDGDDAGGEGAKDHIWVYRLPSVLGALATVLVVYFAGALLFSNRVIAITAAGLTGSSILLTAEAHQATTDAVLCAAMTACMGALGVLYVRRKGRREVDTNVNGPKKWLPSDRMFAAVFWVALAFGIFVKGPIAIIIVLVALFTLTMIDRSVAILIAVFSWIGIGLFLILTATWAVPIHVATNGLFWRDALLGDFLPKVAGGVESHSFPPGFYLGIFILTFWPGSLVAGAALVRAWKMRKPSGDSQVAAKATDEARGDAVRFLFAWTIPMWVVFELTPTKLPHYVLPLYPAVSLLTAAGLLMFVSDGPSEEIEDRTRRVSIVVRIGFILWSVVTVGAGIVLLAGLPELGEPFHWSFVVLVSGIAGAAVWCLVKAWSGRFGSTVAIGVICSAVISISLFGMILPRARAIFTSRLIVEELRRDSLDGNKLPKELVSAGFHEPSLVFLTHSQIQLLSGRKAAEFFMVHPSATILVSDAVLEAFESTLAEKGYSAGIPIGEVRGFNYSKGRWMTVHIFRNLISEVRHVRADGQ